VWRNGSQVARLTTPLNPSFLVYDGSKTAWGDGSASAPVLLPNLQEVNANLIQYNIGTLSNGQLAKTAGYAVSIANDISGGLAGQVVYQTGLNQTGFTATGTNGQLLQSGGIGTPTWLSQGSSTQLLQSNGSGSSPTWIGANDLAITSTGTTTPRTLANRFAEVANVKDFGAVGNGVADDSSAVVAAFASNKEVYFPAGIYRIGNNTTITADKTVCMNSAAAFSVNSGVTLTINASFEGNSNSYYFQGLGSVIGLGEVYTEWFGAIGNKIADDQPAFQKAVTCVQNSFPSGSNAVIRLQSKEYLLGSTWNVYQTANAPIDVIGTGTLIGDSRLWGTSSFTGQLINIQGSTDNIQNIVDFTISGFGVFSQNIGRGTGIYFNLVGNSRLNGLQQSLVENIYIDSFAQGIVLRNTRLVNFKRISVWNNQIDGSIFANANYCVVIQDGAVGEADFCGDFTFDNCQFVTRKDFYSELIRIQAQSATSIIPVGKTAITVAGIRFTECIFYKGGDYSISLFCNNYSHMADIWFNNCQLDDTSGISITTQSANALITNINIFGTYFTAVAGNCVRIDSSIGIGNINAINISDNYSAGIFSSAAVEGRGVHNLIVNNNRWSGCDWAIGSLFNFIDCSQIVCNGNSAGRAGTSLVGNFANFVNLSGTGNYYVVIGNNSAGRATGTLIVNTTGAANTAIANNI
jgi:hypothetical protein